MKNNDLKKLVKKNLVTTLYASVGVAMWKNLYVADEGGVEFDATKGGETSCALFVSSILAPFGLVDMSHATVATTLNKMEDAGWYKITEPKVGAVVEYPVFEGHPHIGFVLEGDDYISNSSKLFVPILHHRQMQDGRIPVAYYWHDALN